MSAAKKLRTVSQAPEKGELASPAFVRDALERAGRALEELRSVSSELRDDLETFFIEELHSPSFTIDEARERGDAIFIQAIRLLRMIEGESYGASGDLDDARRKLEKDDATAATK